MKNISSLLSFLTDVFKATPWIPLIILPIKATLIVILLKLTDKVYHLYNCEYTTMGVLSNNRMLWFLVLGILLINKMWIRITLLSSILLAMLFEYFYFQYFGTYIQPIAFYQMFTEADEVIISFIAEFPSMVIPFFIVLALSLVILTLKMFKQVNSYRNSFLGVIVIAYVFSVNIKATYINLHDKSGKLWHIQAKALLPMPYYHSTDNFMRSLSYFLVGILPKKILSNTIEIFPVLPPPSLKDKNISRNIILVVGESLRAQNLSLLGYDQNTTPLLNEVDGLFYSSIYCAGTMTKTSFSAMINRVRYPGATNQMSSLSNNLFHLAKQNGFTTHFFSNQTDSSLSILQSYMGRKYIDDYASKDILHRTLDGLDNYDISIKKGLETIDLNSGNHFIVLHQRGSHSPYTERYPDEFNVFKETYDNTVLYSDYVLSEILKRVKETADKPTYVIMTSDHGELLGEHGRQGHGWFFKEVYKVPFLFHSERGEEDILASLSLGKIQTHFDVSNLIASLLGFSINDNDIDKRDIYVNGSDIDALSGYLLIKVDDEGNQTSVEEIR